MSLGIDIDDIAVHYGQIVALDGVALAIAPGRVTGLIGQNGSGKSTLFRAIVGSEPLVRGTIRLEGRPAREARRAGRVSHVPQSDSVDWGFPVSVGETVMMGRYGAMGITRHARAADRTAVREALDRVALADLHDRQIGRLSGGQRKRAFVARSIAQQASVMLLDEPFAGVDARSEALIIDVLRELAAEGRTVLVSTHDLTTLSRLADDVVLLRQRVLFHGPVDEATRADRLAAAFGLDLGSSGGHA